MRRGWGCVSNAAGMPPRLLALVIACASAGEPKPDSALLAPMQRPLVRLSTLVAAGVFLAACADKAPVFSNLAHEFVYNTLATSPSAATQAGLHIYPQGHDTLFLDALLDDFSPASRDAQVKYYRGFQDRLKLVSRDKLDAQTQADYDLVSAVAEGTLFSLERERFAERKPQMYAEILGSALFANISLEYADTVTRAAQLAARVARTPEFITTAIANLKASNPIYRSVAIEEMSGVGELIKGMGATFVRGTPSEKMYSENQPLALAAIDKFNTFVRDSLPKLATFDWRMGREMFDTKWKYYLQSDITPGEMLKSAQDSIVAIRSQMYTLSRPLHDAWFPGHRHAGDSAKFLGAMVGEVLGRIGEEHVHRDSLEVQSRRDVEMLGAFVRDKKLMSITDFSNVKVIPTPVFMRGIYGVAGAVFAPALEPKLSSFYWVTPITADWTPARAESRLREYNKYKMLGLTIHEALPGHLVQGEYANRVTPEWRRLLRAVFGSGAYIEGWAVYAEHMMEQAGMNGGDSVKARLTALKAMLRVYTNVVIDAKLHTENMPVDSVVPYLVRESFQEQSEATAKLQRAQLDYVQLNLYPVGLHDWWNLRREVERAEGAAFDLCRFHDTVLSYGPIPVPAVRRLYLAHVAPTSNAFPSRCDDAGSLP